MMNMYERETINNFTRKEKEMKAKKARRTECAICIVCLAVLVVLGVLTIKACANCGPVGYTVKNPQYINEYMTPDVSETIVIVGMSREAILANGWTIVDGPDDIEETDDTDSYDDDCYLPIANPEYVNEYETPDVPKYIYPEA